ncbi:MAG: hypothetical protein K8823_1433 [Cenarchaeum symbiont of Oopsacas minuta]|nr:hypothetical protein [Cenarchaeum symbiont of Oopsacas minuta]
MLLPTISDYLSPGRIFCVEGGVSSAVAVFRAPARLAYAQDDNDFNISVFYTILPN